LRITEWPKDTQLPPVAELAREYGVSRSTAGRAIERLGREGITTAVSRWGSFVAV
jgi:DNA-binding GntR family transcriptional regulator